ncbi:MAG: 50S ribosomal protein L29 [Clostridia bacterium]|jgi:large subunit ribosomal protein L29|nr:50S ribosomal protein L29 [Clostridia bacterium]MDD4275573.1 50S ribosomal protein L29 [Clostridia bacterium]
MKAQELHNMTTDELLAKQKALKVELFNLRFSHATGQLTNPLILNSYKKDIAKVKTILRERELEIARVAKELNKAPNKAKA